MTIEIFSGALFQYCSLKVSTKRNFGAWWVLCTAKESYTSLKNPNLPFYTEAFLAMRNPYLFPIYLNFLGRPPKVPQPSPGPPEPPSRC